MTVSNFHNVPVVAYSGEKDIQEQAADVMEEALKAKGIGLVHLVGPKTGHSYHPETKAELSGIIDRLAAKGRDRVPKRVRFTTYSLRYNEASWVDIEGMEEHWKPAKVDATIKDGDIRITTENVSLLNLRFGPGDSPLTPSSSVVIDGVAFKIEGKDMLSDRSFHLRMRKGGSRWREDNGFWLVAQKRPGQQGPIDDAFLSRFLIVRPTGKPMHEKTGKWAKAEMDRAIREWRRQFRGDALVKDDKDVTKEDIASSNLVLWGDPSSNSLIKRVLPKLPLEWDAKALSLAGKTHESAGHMPALVYPNPLSGGRYVVLNSGVTYREYDYLNNARQHAKLPDWAVIDLSEPQGTRWPGRIADADFFDERWQPKKR
ncbi:MAG: hypothetical protein K2W96_17790 [Gemmataceae bacterium]|nr:hypothetical protein [Gemmataceae bacterium]